MGYLMTIQQVTPNGAAVGLATYYPTTVDSRWTIPGSGWSTAAYGFAALTDLIATSPASPVVYTPAGGQTYDSFDVYYIQNPGVGLGTITATATGGSPVSANCNTGASQVITKITAVCASAGTGNAVSVTGTGAIHLIAIEPWLSTESKIRMGNAGIYATTTTEWASSGLFQTIMAIEGYNPHLTIIMLGINDAAGSVPASTVTANLSTILTGVRAVGDAIIMTIVPSSGSPYTTYEPLYENAIIAWAATNGVPLIDIYARFGYTWQSALMFNGQHPNDLGYWDVAGAVLSYIKQIVG
jgi:lysophospholipase L1-like esterase